MNSGGDEALGEEKDLMSVLLMELRRGTQVLSVLSQMKEPRYGYALVQSLEDRGVTIDPVSYTHLAVESTSPRHGGV